MSDNTLKLFEPRHLAKFKPYRQLTVIKSSEPQKTPATPPHQRAWSSRNHRAWWHHATIVAEVLSDDYHAVMTLIRAAIDPPKVLIARVMEVLRKVTTIGQVGLVRNRAEKIRRFRQSSLLALLYWWVAHVTHKLMMLILMTFTDLFLYNRFFF